ncbi:MAG: isopeptide-forming domain-containing fimbrial protein [Ruminococcus sp.]|nr:isopeptide-forming domain-containing fimbrial protein [Ruminococcus sp.]
MKKTKRLAAALAALAMAVSMMTVSVYAYEQETPTTSVTASEASDDHTFTAYPIVLGDVGANNAITNVVAGDFALVDMAVAAGLATNATLNDVLLALAEMENDSAEARAFAKALADGAPQGGTSIDEDGTALTTGYYLIVEKDENNNATANILKVVGGEALDIASKIKYPTLVKKVGEEKADGIVDPAYGANGVNTYNDVADHSIGEVFPFKLYGTMPSNLAKYAHYMYKFVDSYDESITVDAESIVVKIGDTVVYTNDAADEAAEHGLTVDVSNGHITVNFVDIKVYGVNAASVVTVEYNAQLNENAVIADAGQENAAMLKYSVNYDNDVEWTPYEDTTGDKPNTDNPTPDNPNYPDTPEGGDEETPNGKEEEENGGETPEDKVVVYTYELVIQKTDGTNAITGDAALAAEFTVKTADNKYVTVGTDGKVTGFIDTETKLSLNEAGRLVLTGLDDGVYTITEVTPPTGYKLPANPVFTVTITGGIVTRQDWTGVANDATYVVADQVIESDGLSDLSATTAGTFSASLANSPIGSLPSTGGIGTGIFIVGGGSIALASGIILIAKKRSKKED